MSFKVSNASGGCFEDDLFILPSGFKKMIDGRVSYSVEYFDRQRNRAKVFHILNPQSALVKRICRNEEFIKSGRLRQRFSLKKIESETFETKRGAVTHWPTVAEVKRLLAKGGFKNIEIFGNGLLMGLLLERYEKVTKAMQRQPQLFFEIERKLVPFVDPKKAFTLMLKATT